MLHGLDWMVEDKDCLVMNMDKTKADNIKMLDWMVEDEDCLVMNMDKTKAVNIKMLDWMEEDEDCLVMNMDKTKADQSCLYSLCQEILNKTNTNIGSVQQQHVFEVKPDTASGSTKLEVWAKMEEEKEVRSEVFDVEAVTSMENWTSGYRKFITEVSDKYYAELNSQPKPFFFEPSEEFLDIVLNTCSHKIKLRIKLDEFSLVGYQIGLDEDSEWFEFGHHHSWKRWIPAHVIPRSSFLELDRNYHCIECEIGRGQTLYNVLFGRQQLIDAVRLLATSRDYQQRAWSLIIVRVMLCETVRFPSVLDHLTCTSYPSYPFLPDLAYMIRNIETVSMNTLAAWKTWRSSSSTILNKDIYFLLGSKRRLLFGGPGPFIQLPAKQAGRCELLEVFGLRINNINESCSGKFYGSISFRSGFCMISFYNREEGNPEFIRAGENLLLTYPKSCISITGKFGFNFHILGKKIPNTDIQIDCSASEGKQDVLLCTEFASDDCSLMLSYVTLSDAVQATVEITIMEIDSAVTNVYGQISACLAKFDSHEILLFQTKCLQVYSGMLLELAKSAVAVPWNSSLTIKVELYDDGDEEFVARIGTFHSRLSGSTKKTVSNGCNKIQMKIIWK